MSIEPVENEFESVISLLIELVDTGDGIRVDLQMESLDEVTNHDVEALKRGIAEAIDSLSRFLKYLDNEL